jgi:hypothetical protein
MASGYVNRINRPNTWPHRPMLNYVKKILASSEPSTHEGKADVTSQPANDVDDPYETSAVLNKTQVS